MPLETPNDVPTIPPELATKEDSKSLGIIIDKLKDLKANKSELGSDKGVMFYDSGKSGDFLSNVTASPLRVVLGDKEHKVACSESIYQGTKELMHSGGTSIIDTNGTGGSVQEAGSKFSDNNDNFHKHKLDIMKETLLIKATQNPEILKALLATGDQDITENTEIMTPKPGKLKDSYWGNAIGKDDKPGENNLGKLWVKVRKELSDEMERDGEIKVRCGFSPELSAKTGIASQQYSGDTITIDELIAAKDITLASEISDNKNLDKKDIKGPAPTTEKDHESTDNKRVYKPSFNKDFVARNDVVKRLGKLSDYNCDNKDSMKENSKNIAKFLKEFLDASKKADELEGDDKKNAQKAKDAAKTSLTKELYSKDVGESSHGDKPATGFKKDLQFDSLHKLLTSVMMIPDVVGAAGETSNQEKRDFLSKIQGAFSDLSNRSGMMSFDKSHNAIAKLEGDCPSSLIGSLQGDFSNIKTRDSQAVQDAQKDIENKSDRNTTIGKEVVMKGALGGAAIAVATAVTFPVGPILALAIVAGGGLTLPSPFKNYRKKVEAKQASEEAESKDRAEQKIKQDAKFEEHQKNEAAQAEKLKIDEKTKEILNKKSGKDSPNLEADQVESKEEPEVKTEGDIAPHNTIEAGVDATAEEVVKKKEEPKVVKAEGDATPPGYNESPPFKSIKERMSASDFNKVSEVVKKMSQKKMKVDEGIDISKDNLPKIESSNIEKG